MIVKLVRIAKTTVILAESRCANAKNECRQRGKSDNSMTTQAKRFLR